eukprot:1161321-Pelagomonas_calceolata.AAC.5
MPATKPDLRLKLKEKLELHACQDSNEVCVQQPEVPVWRTWAYTYGSCQIKMVKKDSGASTALSLQRFCCLAVLELPTP